MMVAEVKSMSVEYEKVERLTEEPNLMRRAASRMLDPQGVKRLVAVATGGAWITVTFRRGSYHHGRYHLGQERINFSTPDGLVPMEHVLHEVAHHLHFVSDPQVRAAKTTAERRRTWHGPEFVRILDDLLVAHVH